MCVLQQRESTLCECVNTQQAQLESVRSECDGMLKQIAATTQRAENAEIQLEKTTKALKELERAYFSSVVLTLRLQEMITGGESNTWTPHDYFVFCSYLILIFTIFHFTSTQTFLCTANRKRRNTRKMGGVEFLHGSQQIRQKRNVL